MVTADENSVSDMFAKEGVALIENIYENFAKINLPPRFKEKLYRDLMVIDSYKIQDMLMIILFGSCAKGTFTVTSDIDLMLVTKSRLDFHLCAEISDLLFEPVREVRSDIKFYTLEELYDGTSRFTREVKKYGKVVWKSKGIL